MIPLVLCFCFFFSPLVIIDVYLDCDFTTSAFHFSSLSIIACAFIYSSCQNYRLFFPPGEDNFGLPS